jgi:hypothetical protein
MQIKMFKKMADCRMRVGKSINLEHIVSESNGMFKE